MLLFPTCQVRVVRFYVRCAAPRSSSPSSFFLFPLSSPDLICQLLIAVGLCQRLIAVVVAGPLLPALDGSGPRRTSTASSRALWASPDFNRRESERCGPRRTSTRPQRPQSKPYRMPKRMPKRMPDRMPDRMTEDMPDRMSEDIPDRMSEDLPDRISQDMPDRMSEDMPDGMPDRYAI